MAHFDYVPPGMKAENGILKPLSAGNLPECQRLLTLALAERDNFQREVKELADKIQEIYVQGAPPVLREEIAVVRAENTRLAEELEKLKKPAAKKKTEAEA